MKITFDNEEFFARVTKAQPDLFAFVASMLPFYPDDVLDVAQDVNLKLVQLAAEYDVSRPFKPWMFGIARNAVTHFLQSRQRERVAFDDETVDKCAETLSEESQADLDDTPTLRRLAVCKSKLSERHRKLVALRYTQLFPIPEIGKRLGMSVTSVNDALTYIRKKLYDCLKRLCKISDEQLEAAHPDAFNDLLNACLNSSSSTQGQKRLLLEQVGTSEACRIHYLEQMYIHQMLLQKRFLESRLCKKPFARFFTIWSLPRIAALAACLAFLIGGGLWLFLFTQRQDGRNGEPVVSQTASAVAPVPQNPVPLLTQRHNEHSVAHVAAPLEKQEAHDSSAAVVAAAPKQEKAEVKTKTLAKAAAATVAVATVLPPATVSATDFARQPDGSAASSAAALDTRAGTGACADAAGLDSRGGTSATSKARGLNTNKIKGTVIYLM